MKRLHKITAIILALLLAFSCGTSAFAADGGAGKSVGAVAHVTDSIFGVLHDGIFGALQSAFALKRSLLQKSAIPTLDEYTAAEHPYVYAGTNGEAVGRGWRAGFASGSIIPAAWRCDANGKSDPNGYCFSKTRYTGGYQWKLDKIYTDQMMNLFILSNGTDSNGNGVDDIMVFVNVDGVGVAGGTCKKIRAAVEQALQSDGITAADILSCTVSATHCHVGLDTQGMNSGELAPILLNPFSKAKALDPEMEATLVSQASACAKAAFGKMEDGTLSFFETTPVTGAEDKLSSGAKRKDTFSCFLFAGASGEKTILANLAAHPTAYYNRRMLFTDYPYLMRLAMQDAGCNFLFVQSAQANIGRPSLDTASEAQKKAADEWVKGYALTFDDWAARYGETYAKKNYYGSSGSGDISEEQFEGSMKAAYLLAHHILDASANAKEVAPRLNIRFAQTCIKLEDGLMALGIISGVLDEDVVRVPDAESGYGVMTEIGCIAIGDDVVILTAPGELSPALLLGTDPNYTDQYLWTGKTSWSGEDWPYESLTALVRRAAQDDDKTVLLYGITNDALGYIYPDVMMPQSLLATLLFYPCPSNHKADMTNSVLLTTGSKAASQLMESFIKLIGSN